MATDFTRIEGRLSVLAIGRLALWPRSPVGCSTGALGRFNGHSVVSQCLRYIGCKPASLRLSFHCVFGSLGFRWTNEVVVVECVYHV